MVPSTNSSNETIEPVGPDPYARVGPAYEPVGSEYSPVGPVAYEPVGSEYSNVGPVDPYEPVGEYSNVGPVDPYGPVGPVVYHLGSESNVAYVAPIIQEHIGSILFKSINESNGIDLGGEKHTIVPSVL
jgi:hypothetical protein